MKKKSLWWCEIYDHDMKYEFHLPLTIFYLLDDDNDIFESKWNKMTYFKMLGFFFFFFLWETLNFIQKNQERTSCKRACSKKQRFSFIHTRKSSMPTAYFANKWAGLLSFLLTWKNSTLLNSLHISIIPNTIEATDKGGGEVSQRALKIINESLSKIIYWIPMSLARCFCNKYKMKNQICNLT